MRRLQYKQSCVKLYLPTTVSSILSSSKAMKTINRINLLDCLSSRNHLKKPNSRSLPNPPILRVNINLPWNERKKRKTLTTSISSKPYVRLKQGTSHTYYWGGIDWRLIVSKCFKISSCKTVCHDVKAAVSCEVLVLTLTFYLRLPKNDCN